MFLFESLLKIERKPNKLYLITKYTIKSFWSKSYKKKIKQLRQERQALSAHDPEVQKKDIRRRHIGLIYSIPVMLILCCTGYNCSPDAAVQQCYYWCGIIGVTLVAFELIASILSNKMSQKLYENQSKYKGIFDIALIYIKTMLIYQMEIIKTIASYYAFLFIIRLVWCIILFETGLDAFFTPPTRLGLDELYLYVGGILVGLFAITLLSRTMKKSVVKSWEKLDGILAKLESPEPLAAQFIS